MEKISNINDNTFSTIKSCLSVSENFHIKNGIMGMTKDIFFFLIQKMYWEAEFKIRNMIGVSSEWVNQIKHRNFLFVRTHPMIGLNTLLMNNHYDSYELIGRTVKFYCEDCNRSVFFKQLIKGVIVECKIKISYSDENSDIFFGVVSPYQVEYSLNSSIGYDDRGGSFCFNGHDSLIMCNDRESPGLIEGGLRDGSTVCMVVEHMHPQQNGVRYWVNGRRLPHTIVHMPREGVYAGFSCFWCMCYVTVLSFGRLLSSPPTLPPHQRCLCYDFNGDFGNIERDMKDEEGRRVENVMDYFVREEEEEEEDNGERKENGKGLLPMVGFMTS